MFDVPLSMTFIVDQGKEAERSGDVYLVVWVEILSYFLNWETIDRCNGFSVSLQTTMPQHIGMLDRYKHTTI
jgi:hypothetical protein